MPGWLRYLVAFALGMWVEHSGGIVAALHQISNWLGSIGGH